MDEKYCRGCERTLCLEAFYRNRAGRLGRAARCKNCEESTRRKRYRAKRKQILAAERDVRQVRCREHKLQLLRYLLDHPCVDCGEADPIVLEFDHRPGTEKRYTVSFMVQATFGWATIEEEIAKCDVRCANCHRRRHAIERLGWKLILLPEVCASADCGPGT